MNATALKQVMGVWAEVLDLALSLRQEYLLRWPRSFITSSDLWAMTYMGAILPYYMNRRNLQPVPENEIPVVVSALFKVLAGVFQAAGHAALLDAAAGLERDRACIREGLLAHAEQHGVFESARGVCAGPPDHIRSFLELLLSGSAKEAPPSFTQLAGNCSEFFGFAVASVHMEISKCLLLFQYCCAEKQLQDFYQHRALDDQPSEQARTYFAGRPFFGPRSLLETENSCSMAERITSYLIGELTEYGFSFPHYWAGGHNQRAASETADFIVHHATGFESTSAQHISELLIRGAVLDQLSMRLLSFTQSQIEQSFGNDGPAGDLTHFILERGVHHELAKWLGLQLIIGPERVTLSSGSQRLELPLLAAPDWYPTSLPASSNKWSTQSA